MKRKKKVDLGNTKFYDTDPDNTSYKKPDSDEVKTNPTITAQTKPAPTGRGFYKPHKQR